MAKAVAEESSVIKAHKSGWRRRHAQEDFDDLPGGLESVPGGRVRRIEFEGSKPVEAPPEPEPEPEEASEREFVPRHRASIEDIQFEVDHLDMIRGGSSARRRMSSVRDELREKSLDAEEAEAAREDMIYRTGRGGVSKDYAPAPGGRRRRVLYLEDDAPGESRRFHAGLVDRIIKDVDLEEETVVEETVTEVVPETETPEDADVVEVLESKPAKKASKPHKAAKKAAATTRKSASKAKASGAKATASVKKAPAKAKAETKKTASTAKKATSKAQATPVTPEKDYQPQCEALTADGKQCRNSSRKGSKYCGSHKGYQPKSASKLLSTRDTAPRHAKAKDTTPKVVGKAHDEVDKAKDSHQEQCAAITAGGKQCRNSSRKGSKYCASHKGYRPKSTETLRETRRTKPRVAGAKDTKPAVRKK